MPFRVPATLKSISPRWSSSPMISVSTAYLSPSTTRPMATPPTADLTGTPAAMRAKVAPPTEAIHEEPLLSPPSPPQPHGPPPAGRLDGDAGVHEGQGGSADGGHRGGAVTLQDVRDDPNGVRELLRARENGEKL